MAVPRCQDYRVQSPLGILSPAVAAGLFQVILYGKGMEERRALEVEKKALDEQISRTFGGLCIAHRIQRRYRKARGASVT